MARSLALLPCAVTLALITSSGCSSDAGDPVGFGNTTPVPTPTATAPAATPTQLPETAPPQTEPPDNGTQSPPPQTEPPGGPTPTEPPSGSTPSEPPSGPTPTAPPTPIPTPTATPTAPVDEDGDGWGAAVDCQDDDPAIHPQALELCDDTDQDCDGLTRDVDADGDGYDDPSCGGDDCDDALASVHPGAEETCSDGVDTDCDGEGCLPSEVFLRVADVQLDGTVAAYDVGNHVVSAGDVNGDGFEDLLTSAGLADGLHENTGAAYLFYGPVDRSQLVTQADVTFIGKEKDEFVGTGIAGAGDVNNDGYDDLLIGNALSGSNGVYLFYGPIAAGILSMDQADAEIIDDATTSYLGTYIAGAGDLNGDGYDDIVAGDPYADEGGDDSGTVYLFNGPLSGSLDPGDATAVITGPANFAHLGRIMDGAGDVNGDGKGDLLLGCGDCEGEDEGAGIAGLFLGPLEGTYDLSQADARIYGTIYRQKVGAQVQAAGDVNGDGIADILIGAPGDDREGNPGGGVGLFLGPIQGDLDLEDADARIVNNRYRDAAYQLGEPGDVNGDGFADTLVGSNINATGDYAGTAFLFLGPYSGEVDLKTGAAVTYYGQPHDGIGSAMTLMDVNGDGFDDAALGAPIHRNAGGEFTGAVYVSFGGY